MPEPAKNLTASQVPDAAAAYLAEVRQAAGLLSQTKAPSWGTVPRIKRMIGYAERMADALEAAQATHPVHDNGIAAPWCVPCSKEAQAAQLGSEPTVFVNAEDCKLRQAITAELTGERQVSWEVPADEPR